MTETAAPELLTADEAARFLRLHRNRVYAFVRDGELRAVRLGDGSGRLRIRREELERFLEEREQ